MGASATASPRSLRSTTAIPIFKTHNVIQLGRARLNNSGVDHRSHPVSRPRPDAHRLAREQFKRLETAVFPAHLEEQSPRLSGDGFFFALAILQ